MSKPLNQVTIRETALHSLLSSKTGQEYIISVAFPAGYAESGKKYSVCYLLDAQYFFGMATEYTRILSAGEEIQDLIIVGIGFPFPVDDVQPHRKWNYVPPEWNDEEGNGGAEGFLDFIRHDLVPFVESEYRVTPTDRWLYGDSRGGLFVIYALLQHVQVFNRYIVGSPWFTQNDPDEVFQFEEDYAATHSDLAANLFMAAGSLEPEPVVNNILKLNKVLRSRGYKNLSVKTHIFEDETHMSVTTYNLSKGLKAVSHALSNEEHDC